MIKKLFNIKKIEEINIQEITPILIGLFAIFCFFVGYLIGKDLAMP